MKRSQEKKERKKGSQNNALNILCKMSIKQTLKKSESKTNDEIDLCISSTKVVSATTPVIRKKLEHSETILSIRDFDATKESVPKVLNESVSYTKYSDEERFKIRKHCSENGVAMGLRKFKQSFPNLTESVAQTFRLKYEK